MKLEQNILADQPVSIPVAALWLLLVSALLLPVTGFAKGQYLTSPQFLEKAFPDQVPGGAPQPKVLWLNADSKQQLSHILNHRYAALRVRYWLSGNRTAWILEEIGKELPISIGIVVEDDRVVQIEILAFRESRGGEVRHAFFRDQFRGLSLDSDQRLSRHIDGITGATLSVRAVSRSTRAALYLHQLALPRSEPPISSESLTALEPSAGLEPSADLKPSTDSGFPHCTGQCANP